MKVYVTILSRTSEGEDMGSEYPKVFSTKDNAINDMKDFIHGKGNEYNLCIEDNYKIENDSEDYFLAYKDGHYATDHTYMEIIEREVL